jgi:histidine ammonia-lyase
MAVVLTGSRLTLEDVERVARRDARVVLATDAVERMASAREIVAETLVADSLVYGLTTGVGMRRNTRVPVGEIADFNRRLIANHQVGAGPHAPIDVVRATMLRLLNAFCGGWVGVRPELAERLAAALNDGVAPKVRVLGSVGQADLAPMADLARGIFDGFELEPKEGLALLNTSSFATGWGALAVADATRLLSALDVCAALDLEAFQASLSVLHPVVEEARPYPGLRTSLRAIRGLLEGSALWEASAARNLQDPLSFRTAVGVNGAAHDAMSFVRSQLETELNASQDNPIVVLDERRIISVGNHEIQPLATALDIARLAIAPALTAACERTVKLLQSHHSGLPEGLAAVAGLAEDGLAEYGVAVQGIASEARLLAQPVSYELASTTHADGVEDRTTMAPLAARRLSEMVDLAEHQAAISLTVSCQAIELRGRMPLGEGCERVVRLVRERIPFLAAGSDIPWTLQPLLDLLRSGALVDAVKPPSAVTPA